MTEMRQLGTTCSSEAISTLGRADAAASSASAAVAGGDDGACAEPSGGGLDSTAQLSAVMRTSVAYSHHVEIHATPTVHVSSRLTAISPKRDSPTLTEMGELMDEYCPGLAIVRSV